MKTHGKVTEQEVHAAIEAILTDTAHYSTSLNWAVNYCRAAEGMTGHELAVQCLYILNNLASWRHKEAKNIRLVLREFAHQEGRV